MKTLWPPCCRCSRTLVAWTVGLGLYLVGGGTFGRATPIVFENDALRYGIATNGLNLEFVDRVSGINYLRGEPSACASIRLTGQTYPASAAAWADQRLTLQFGTSGVTANLRVELRRSYLRFTVESVAGPPVQSLTFLSIPLSVAGRPEEGFGACAFSMNLRTRVDALPALQRDLQASCEFKFGIIGAQAALVGVPMHRMIPALKDVLTESDEMPHCPVAGPWASEIPFNHGSYLFNFGSLTETNVNDWISMARQLGVTQIDNHGGSAFFRFGDFALNPSKWPDGWEGYQRIVQRLHDAGIDSIFHTYAFFIDKQSKYVSPVPDSRLDAFRSFHLSAPISPEASELLVDESTEGLSTVTGFFEHNSVVLHVDDELMTFSHVSQAPPWRFSGLNRGAFGTKAGPHEKGTRARQLKECFGLFVPDVDSTLFEEIARQHAEIVNAVGFDGIYLDAIDGSSILRGADECWFWADKFVLAIQRYLKKPVGMEMSAMWHHFWQYRTRWQAWDYPQRGHKRFIDLHAQAAHGGLLLPLHLGWWNFQTFDPPQIEPTYPDVIEYLGTKLIGWDAGVSLTGAIDPRRLEEVPLFRRAVNLLHQSEELRRKQYFSEAIRARLREPGREFSLVSDSAGQWRVRPAQVDAHNAALGEPWTLVWYLDNPYAAQPLQFRLEALMSVSAYDDPENIVLADLGAPGTFAGTVASAEGVSVALNLGPTLDGATPEGQFSATNSGRVPRRAAWARWERKFDPALSLKQHRALGLPIEGDGLGEVVALRLESPKHLSFGAIADRYVTVDFVGRRLVSLVETESSRWSDYDWGDTKSLYNAYRESVDFGNIDRLSLWLQNLAPEKRTKCGLGKLKALKLLPGTIRQPRLTVNGASFGLPVEMTSGSFMEVDDRSHGVVYGAKGEALRQVNALGEELKLQRGANRIEFTCDRVDGPQPRVRVVIFLHGDPL